MIRILIVEDEPQILRDLVSMVNRIDSDYVATAASNAIEARLLIEKSTFDVILTDISMPVMSGLELIEWIKAQKYPIVPVIISGYSDFDYARQAIRLDVTDYILKPAIEQDVSKTLAVIAEGIRSARSQVQHQSLQKMIIEGSQSFAKSLPEIENQFMAVFCIGALTDTLIVDETIRAGAWEQLQLCRQINSLLDQAEAYWIFRSSSSTNTVLIDLNGHNISLRYPRLLEQLSAIRGVGFGLTIAVSPVYHDAASVSIWHRRLINLLQQSVILGKNQLITEQSVFQAPTDQDDASQTAGHENIKAIKNSGHDHQGVYYETIATMIRYHSPGVNKALQQIILGWKNDHLPQAVIERTLMKLTENITMAMFSELSKEDSQKIESAMREALYNALSFDSLYDNLQVVMDGLVNDLAQQIPEDRHDRLVSQMTVYIGQHLTESLNNNILAGKFGLAPSYISSLFRRKTGVSPIEYIAGLRMKKACQIIEQSPQMPTKDVAELVGYKDPLHFSKSFRKLIGQSPAEFRQAVTDQGSPVQIKGSAITKF